MCKTIKGDPFYPDVPTARELNRDTAPFVVIAPVEPAPKCPSDVAAFTAMLRKGNVEYKVYQGQFAPFHSAITIKGSNHTNLDFIFDKDGNFLERQINMGHAIID